MKSTIFILLPIIALSSVAHANNDIQIRNGSIYTKKDTWFLEIGGGASSDLFKSQDNHPSPIFNTGYYSDDLNVDIGSHTVSYRFYGQNEDLINFSSYLNTAGVAYSQNDADVLAGMDSRDASFDFGLNTDFNLENGTLTTYIQHDLSNKYGGFIGGAKYFYPMKIETIDFVPYAGVSYQSADYVDYYFGVKEHEANKKRQQYKGQSDVSYELGYKLIIPISENWDITQTSSYTRLGDNISDSPIVDSPNQWVVGATAAYSF